MNVQNLKEYILDNNYIEQILDDLGCKAIKQHSGYFSATNPDGDARAIVVYLNEMLTCVNYTRTLSKTKRATDIFDLVMFFEGCTFAEALKWVCNVVGLDYYSEPQDIPESLQIIKMLQAMSCGDNEEDDTPLKPISEKILDYYLPYGNVMLEDDNISLETQREFEICFDPQTNSICFPIRDELGTLIAVKARRFKYSPNVPLDKRRFPDELREDESKYFFSEPGAKSQVLYGLYKNIKVIQLQGTCFVGESEKFVLQLYEMGYYGVSTGGSKISKRQVEMLTRLGVQIVFCYDEDIKEEDLKNIAHNFLDGIPIYAMIDKENVLNEKESPSDNAEKWIYLIQNHIYQIK